MYFWVVRAEICWERWVASVVCVCVCVIYFIVSPTTSSALAVSGEELVEQDLECLVGAHAVVLAQVVAARRTSVHLRAERSLETRLERKNINNSTSVGTICELERKKEITTKKLPSFAAPSLHTFQIGKRFPDWSEVRWKGGQSRIDMVLYRGRRSPFETDILTVLFTH